MQFEEIKSLYFEYLDLNEDKKTPYLKNLKDNNKIQYDQLFALIKEEKMIRPILKNPSEITFFHSILTTLKGKQVDKYLVGELIEEGGMGAVYHAKRNDGEFDQEVAIKFIRPSGNKSEFIERFRHERQILAKLQHPNIVRLLDGGKTDQDLLYFTMEYVEGLPLDKYLASKNQSAKDKLKLFEQICQAVEYAHQNLVLHLDLKPANILVTEASEIKILDFGIAQKMLGHQDHTSLNENARYSMAFAAPELIKGGDVNTQSDVFSLSSILYFMFNDGLPFGQKSDSVLEYKSNILNKAPLNFPKPSTPSDIALIYKKGLKYDGFKRYHSVNELNDDVLRYIDNRPISLKKDDYWYRFQKYLARNKWISLTVAMASTMLIVSTLYYTKSLKHQRDIAVNESEKATVLNGLMTNLLQSANPFSTQGDTITIGEILGNAIPSIKDDLVDQPELKAEMMLILGNVYLGLQNYEAADSILHEASKIVSTTLENNKLKALAMSHLGDFYYAKGEYNKAGMYFDTAFNNYLNIEDRKGQLEMQQQLSYIADEKNDYDKSDSIIADLYINYKDILIDNPSYHAEVLQSLGMAKYSLGEFNNARDFFNHSLKLKNEIYKSPHTEIAYTLNYLSSLNYKEKNYEEALKFGQESFEQRKAVLGMQNTETLAAASNVARINLALENLDVSLGLYKEILGNFRIILGESHTYITSILGAIGKTYRLQGKYDQALMYYDSSQFVLNMLPEPNSFQQATLNQSIGLTYQLMNKNEKAKLYFLKSIDGYIETFGEDDSHVKEVRKSIEELE